MGAHKRWRKPQSFRENRGKSVLESRASSGLVGAFPGPFRSQSGANASAPRTHGEEQKLLRKGLFGPIGAFWAKPPPFAKPQFGFHRQKLALIFGSSQTWLFLTWMFAIFMRRRSFALCCAILRSFAPFCRLARSFALCCAILRSFALFALFCAHLRLRSFDAHLR